MRDVYQKLVFLPLLLVVGRLLAVLKAAMCRCAILLIVALLLIALLLRIVVALALLLWRVARLLISALIPALLLRRILLAVRRVLLIALVVLIVRARHGEFAKVVRWVGGMQKDRRGQLCW
jgi:hypothetical protein